MVRTFALGKSCLQYVWRHPGRNLRTLTACCFCRCALRRIWSVFVQLNATRSRPKQTHCVLWNILGVPTGKVQNIGSSRCCLFLSSVSGFCAVVSSWPYQKVFMIWSSLPSRSLVTFATLSSQVACDSKKDREVGRCFEGPSGQ